MRETPSLAENLAQSEAIKAELIVLLRELEIAATGKSIAKPGGWRHNPADWADQNLPQRPPKSPSI